MNDPYQAPTGARLRAVAGFAAVSVVVGVAATVAALTIGPVGAAEEPAGASAARFHPPPARPLAPPPGVVGAPGLVEASVRSRGVVGAPVVDVGAPGLVEASVPPGAAEAPGVVGAPGLVEASVRSRGVVGAPVVDVGAPGGLDVPGPGPVIDGPGRAAAGYSARTGAAGFVFQSTEVADCVQSDAEIATEEVRQATDGLPADGHLLRKVSFEGVRFDDPAFVAGNFDFADFANPNSLPVLLWFWTPH